MEVVTYHPHPSEFAWTFGGVKPVRTVKPGDLLELWTEDAFAGKVRTPEDLVSKVCEFPFSIRRPGPSMSKAQSPETRWRFTSFRSSPQGTGPPRPRCRCSVPSPRRPTHRRCRIRCRRSCG